MGIEEAVALQQKFEGVESALCCIQDELGVERIKRMELEAAQKLLEDMEMGGTSSSLHSQGTIVDTTINTEKRTYVQAVVQAQVEGKLGVTFDFSALSDVSNDTRKKLEATSVEVASMSTSASRGSLRSHCEVEIEGSIGGAITKAVVIYGISTN